MELSFPRPAVIIVGVFLSLAVLMTIIYNKPLFLESGYFMSLPGGSRPKNGARVLLITYYRSGSSFLGEMFANRHDTFYVFEPIHGLLNKIRNRYTLLGRSNHLKDMGSYVLENHSIGHDSKDEMQIRIDALRQTFDCSIPELDKDILLGTMFTNAAHMPILNEYRACVRSRRLPVCAKALANKCLDFSNVVVKTIRYPVYAVPWLFELFPDLKVIHYIRDPRAILSSRYHLKRYRKAALVLEKSASDLCLSMADNYAEYQRLKSLYPSNIFLVKYEDLASYPEETTLQMYRFAGLGDALPSGVKNWIDVNTKSKSHNFDQYGTHRVSSSRIDRWKDFWPDEEIKAIMNACNQTLKLLGYQE